MSGRGTGIAGAMDYRPPSSLERAAHCFICGGPWRAGASYAARVLPPMVEVCSAACAADRRFAEPARVTAPQAR